MAMMNAYTLGSSGNKQWSLQLDVYIYIYFPVVTYCFIFYGKCDYIQLSTAGHRAHVSSAGSAWRAAFINLLSNIIHSVVATINMAAPASLHLLHYDMKL